MTDFGTLTSHLPQLRAALTELERHEAVLQTWAWQLGEAFRRGGRLLAAGNGGSAAEAQHLTAELVGRFELDRPPLAAIALHAETSSLTAIGNDFGAEEIFARQVEAHGRPGDVLLLLSTSGRSVNLLRGAERGLACGLDVWAMTGPTPNPLAAVADSALAIEVDSATAVQEVHLVAVHALCAELERRLQDPQLPPGRRRLHAVPRGQGWYDGRRRNGGPSRLTGPATSPVPSPVSSPSTPPASWATPSPASSPTMSPIQKEYRT